MSRATRTPSPATACLATEMAAVMISSTLWPVRRSFRPLAPKVLA